MYAYADKSAKSNKEHNPVQAKNMSPYESKFPAPRSNVIQMLKVSAKAEMSFQDKDSDKTITAEATNKDSVPNVLGTIAKPSQTWWISQLPTVTNKRGKCAEPKSLAKVLQKGYEEAGNYNYKINYIYVHPAEIKEIGERGGRDDYIHERGYRVGYFYPACKTCQQWVGKLGRYRPYSRPVSVGLDEWSE